MPEQQTQPPALFTVHIGNTHVNSVCWSAAGQVLVCGGDGKADARGIKALAAALLSAGGKNTPIVIAGVVPRLKTSLVKLLKKRGGKVLVFRRDFVPEIEIVPEPPEKAGDDRVAAALGALALDASVPWIVVDAGTALTCNAVTPARGGKLPRLEGGLIAPGAAMSLNALARQTAQLPELIPDPGDASDFNFIGRSTEQAMRHGVMLAQVAALLAMLEGQKGILGPQTRVVITGGGAAALQDAIKKAAPAPLDHPLHPRRRRPPGRR